MKCASNGCDKLRIKGRTLCRVCKGAREDMTKVTCCVPECKHPAVMEGIKCRFCLSREKAMAAARVPNTTGMKRCGKCKETKTVYNFSVNSDNPDGLDSTCKPCRKAAKGTRQATKSDAQHEAHVYFGSRELSQLLTKPLSQLEIRE